MSIILWCGMLHNKENTAAKYKMLFAWAEVITWCFPGFKRKYFLTKKYHLGLKIKILFVLKLFSPDLFFLYSHCFLFFFFTRPNTRWIHRETYLMLQLYLKAKYLKLWLDPLNAAPLSLRWCQPFHFLFVWVWGLFFSYSLCHLLRLWHNVQWRKKAHSDYSL